MYDTPFVVAAAADGYARVTDQRGALVGHVCQLAAGTWKADLSLALAVGEQYWVTLDQARRYLEGGSS